MKGNKYLVLSLIVIIIIFSFTGCFDSGNLSAKRTGSINGVVKNSSSEEIIKGASISVGKNNDTTDNNGIFKINDLEVGDYLLIVIADGFENKEVNITVEEGSNNLGSILMNEVTESENKVSPPTGLKLHGGAGMWDTNNYYVLPNINGWSTNSSNIDSYKLYRSKDQHEDYSFIKHATYDDNINHWYVIDWDIKGRWGEKFYYRLSSVNEDNKESDLSLEYVSFEMKEQLTVNHPENNTVITANTITFNWNSSLNYEDYTVWIEKEQSESNNYENGWWTTHTDNTEVTPDINFEPGNYRWYVRGTKGGHTANVIASATPIIYFTVE